MTKNQPSIERRVYLMNIIAKQIEPAYEVIQAALAEGMRSSEIEDVIHDVLALGDDQF